MRVALLGSRGKVGRDLGPALERAGYKVRGIDVGDTFDLHGIDAIVDFTVAAAVEGNVGTALEHDIPSIVGTTGLSRDLLARLDEMAREHGQPLFVAPNFSIGAVLMMRFAREAAQFLPRAEIIELHNEEKLDAPSGMAKATAEIMGVHPAIHSVRLPGLIAHQEVLLAGEGQLLTIRHDTLSREAYAPGVIMALERLGDLPPGLTAGLDALLR